MNRWLAEACGTFVIVFAGTGAIVVDSVSGGAIGHVGVAIVFGLVVTAMIHAFGDISGAHLNPAVTVAFAVAGKFPPKDLLGYLIAQIVGAIAASGVLRLLFPAARTLGETLPTGSVTQSFFLELILTTILMMVILSVSTGAKEKGITAGIAIGSVIAFEAMFAGPISGGSMNPARSLGPALVSGNLQHLWLYLVATILGAVAAVPLCSCIRGKECCGIQTTES